MIFSHLISTTGDPSETSDKNMKMLKKSSAVDQEVNVVGHLLLRRKQEHIHDDFDACTWSRLFLVENEPPLQHTAFRQPEHVVPAFLEKLTWLSRLKQQNLLQRGLVGDPSSIATSILLLTRRNVIAITKYSLAPVCDILSFATFVFEQVLFRKSSTSGVGLLSSASSSSSSSSSTHLLGLSSSASSSSTSICRVIATLAVSSESSTRCEVVRKCANWFLNTLIATPEHCREHMRRLVTMPLGSSAVPLSLENVKNGRTVQEGTVQEQGEQQEQGLESDPLADEQSAQNKPSSSEDKISTLRKSLFGVIFEATFELLSLSQDESATTTSPFFNCGISATKTLGGGDNTLQGHQGGSDNKSSLNIFSWPAQMLKAFLQMAKERNLHEKRDKHKTTFLEDETLSFTDFLLCLRCTNNWFTMMHEELQSLIAEAMQQCSNNNATAASGSGNAPQGQGQTQNSTYNTSRGGPLAPGGPRSGHHQQQAGAWQTPNAGLGGLGTSRPSSKNTVVPGNSLGIQQQQLQQPLPGDPDNQVRRIASILASARPGGGPGTPARMNQIQTPIMPVMPPPPQAHVNVPFGASSPPALPGGIAGTRARAQNAVPPPRPAEQVDLLGENLLTAPQASALAQNAVPRPAEQVDLQEIMQMEDLHQQQILHSQILQMQLAHAQGQGEEQEDFPDMIDELGGQEDEDLLAAEYFKAEQLQQQEQFLRNRMLLAQNLNLQQKNAGHDQNVAGGSKFMNMLGGGVQARGSNLLGGAGGGPVLPQPGPGQAGGGLYLPPGHGQELQKGAQLQQRLQQGQIDAQFEGLHQGSLNLLNLPLEARLHARETARSLLAAAILGGHVVKPCRASTTDETATRD
ncbi:unnamed protein product [Amoebophrya sp. A25]|nr:unnamed protein product [Amoebophrya sp. A25]|eukprot:GSA25T00026164001.1